MINETNYYAVGNRGLSQSKIKMYEQDPNYMYRACISGELVREDNVNFLLGREVDGILTEVDKASKTRISSYKDFRTKDAREERDDYALKGISVVSKKEYEKIMAIAIAVQETTIWKFIEKNCTFQKILVMAHLVLGKYFDCLYGKPDCFQINKDGICDLYDLKTSVTVDKKKFFLKAKELGYFKQMWMYRKLLKFCYPQITGFRYWFVVAEKSEPYRVVLFSISERLVDKCDEEMVELIDRISNDNDFKKADASFENAIELCDPFEKFEDMVAGGLDNSAEEGDEE